MSSLTPTAVLHGTIAIGGGGGGEDRLPDLMFGRYTGSDTVIIAGNDTITGYSTNYKLSLPNATSISGGAFKYSGISGIDAPNVGHINSNTFQGCQMLDSVSLPACTSVDSYAFSGCVAMESVSLPACTSVGSYGYESCAGLQSVSLPECTSIGAHAFEGCTSLQSVSLPECTSIGTSAFASCMALTSVSLPKCTSIGASAFSTDMYLADVYLGSPTMCVLANRNAFTQAGSSTTARKTTVHVTADLLSTYQSDSAWSTANCTLVGDYA